MTIDECNQAYALLARRADLQARLSAVAQATTLTGVADTLTGTGLETVLLSQSRTNVADFISVTIQQVEAQLCALGIVLTPPLPAAPAAAPAQPVGA